MKLARPAFLQKKHIYRYIFVLLFAGAGVLYVVAQALAADSGRYLIDFGSSSFQTTPGWNNISDAQARNTTTTFSLVDSTGAASGVTFRFTDPFNCVPSGNPVNTNGTTSSTVYPANATRDSFFLGTTGGACGQTDTSAAFVLGGLEQGSVYDVKFYASRTGDTTNRTTNYTIGTTTVPLNASNNVNNFALISNVAPVNGTITATVAKAASSAMYGYLGAVELIRKTTGNTPPVANAGPDTNITLPVSGVALSGTGSDTDGTIASYAWTEVSSGAATIASPTSASTGASDLAAGTYTFRLTVTDNQGATATDDVTVTVNPNNVAGCTPKKIVVLGSSTAAGTGASPVSNSWVNRYAQYLQQLNAGNQVVNLAVGGFTTYHVLPTPTDPSVPPPVGRPAPDETHNITTALANSPNLIIVNLPSNDVANGYTLSEIQANFQTLKNTAAQANVPIWFTTPQPRDFSQAQRDMQMALRDWTNTTFAPSTVDYWTTVANADGTINATYGSGDGVHLNNLGHQKLYNRTAGSNIIESLCNQPPVISGVSSSHLAREKITWTTDVPTSSKVEYGTTTTYGSTTTETDTSPRVTNHIVELTSLSLCTVYHYRVISKDGALREQVSGDNTFTTLCN